MRKPGRKLFASVKERDRGRRSPSLSRLRGRSTADIRGHAHTLGLGQSRAYSISTGELLSPELHKARYLYNHLARRTSVITITILGFPCPLWIVI